MCDNCKMICCDIDGTLLDSQLRLPQENAQAIKEVTKAVIPFVLTSGRIAGSLLDIQQQIGITGPIISLNGAYVFDGNNILDEHTFPIALAKSVYQSARQSGMQVFLFKGRNWYANEADEWTDYESAVTNVPGIIGPIDTLYSQWEEQALAPHKILCMSKDPQLVCTMETTLKEAFGDKLTIYRSSNRYIEVLAKGIDKGTAIRSLSSALGLEVQQVMAIGDFYNDIPMLDMAGYAVAMDNAPNEVKEHANLITFSNDEHGVAHVIRTHILGMEDDQD